MTITKREFAAIDAQPQVMYGKKDGNKVEAFPVLVGANGGLLVSQGSPIPFYDTQIIDESASPNVTITYKSSGSTVAIKTIVVSGSTTTITVT
jgi:hypothetical protein